MVEVGSSLAIVVGALVLLRVGLQVAGVGRRAPRRRSLRVVDTCALGPRRRVHVIEAEGQRLLVGVSERGLSLLHVLGAAESPEADEAPVETTETDATPRLAMALPAWLRAGARLLAPAILLAVVLAAPGAQAQETADAAGPALTLSLDGATAPESLSSTLEVLGLITLVTIAPSLLLMATCFTRIVIVLAFLRQAIGVQHLPPNQVLIGLALFTTLFVMTPVADQIRVQAYEPYVAEEIPAPEAAQRALQPVRGFLMSFTRESDLDLFLELAGRTEVATLEEVPLTTLLPAYMISELRTAFEIGFMLYLPFLVIDLVIASMLISMGMIVLPPIVISLPFKLMLFVLLDGWHLVLGSLMTGLR